MNKQYSGQSWRLTWPNSPAQLKRFIIALCARKNGGCPHADIVGLFLAFKYEIRMPPRHFEMAHPISQDYALQTFEKAHLQEPANLLKPCDD